MGMDLRKGGQESFGCVWAGDEPVAHFDSNYPITHDRNIPARRVVEREIERVRANVKHNSKYNHNSSFTSISLAATMNATKVTEKVEVQSPSLELKYDTQSVAARLVLNPLFPESVDLPEQDDASA